MNNIFRILYFGRYFFILAYIYVVYAGIIMITEKYLHRSIDKNNNALMSFFLYLFFFMFIVFDLLGHYILALSLYPIIINILVVLISSPFSKYEKKSFSSKIFSENSKFIVGFLIMNAIFNSIIQIMNFFFIVPVDIENVGYMLTFFSFPFLIAFCIESIVLRKLYNSTFSFNLEQSIIISCFYISLLIVLDVFSIAETNVCVVIYIFPFIGAVFNIFLAFIFDLIRPFYCTKLENRFLMFSDL